MILVSIPRKLDCRICNKRFSNEIRKSGIAVVTCPACRDEMRATAMAAKKAAKKKR